MGSARFECGDLVERKKGEDSCRPPKMMRGERQGEDERRREDRDRWREREGIEQRMVLDGG